MHVVRYLILIACLLVLVSGCSLAVCGMPQPRLICAEYFESDAVVTAELVSRRYFEPPHDQDYYIYTLRTITKLRGETPATFQVWEENASSRAPFDWRVGRKYLLFLSDYAEEHKAYTLDGCGNSSSLAEAKRTLETIRQLQTKHQNGGAIYGVVGRDDFERMSKVKISASGQGHVFRTITDAKGRFSIRVPAGTYQVSAELPSYKFDNDMFSYSTMDDVEIVDNSCAQMWITAMKK